MAGRPNASVLDALVRLPENGHTLRDCASGVGVHVATVCRWQARDPDFYRRMREAENVARRIHYARFPQGSPRPLERWRRDCPLCQARVAVRTAPRKLSAVAAAAGRSPTPGPALCCGTATHKTPCRCSHTSARAVIRWTQGVTYIRSRCRRG